MDGNDSVLTYGQLIGEVRRLCAQHQTGRVFITTSDNHSVSFGLQNGAIVALGFRNQTGLDALAAIQRVHKGSLGFASGLPPKPQPGLPPTPELLALLQSAAADPSGAADAGPRRVNAAVARSRAVIEAELIEYLGPMARVVIDEHATAAHDLADFIDLLAAELNDFAKSATFKDRVREKLASSASGKRAR
jgi:hypothetical protein